MCSVNVQRICQEMKTRRLVSKGLLALGFCAAGGAVLWGQQPAEWTAPQEPVRVYGNTFWVGTRGLGAVLITSDDGHVLIDGAVPEAVPTIAANIRAAGFKVEDIRLILNSHVHFDHAGGIGELARMSGATVAASASSAKVFESGRSGPDDPQFGTVPPIATVRDVRVVKDGEVLRVGTLALTAHATPGHTPGGTSWSWQSCENAPGPNQRCTEMVYADSLTPVASDGFRYTASKDYPQALADFERSFKTLESLTCDILITPHPAASNFWTRLAGRTAETNPLVDRNACRTLVASSRKALAVRVAREKAGDKGL
jgi:metallo-beta-lactamase class B